MQGQKRAARAPAQQERHPAGHPPTHLQVVLGQRAGARVPLVVRGAGGGPHQLQRPEAARDVLDRAPARTEAGGRAASGGQAQAGRRAEEQTKRLGRPPGEGFLANQGRRGLPAPQTCTGQARAQSEAWPSATASGKALLPATASATLHPHDVVGGGKAHGDVAGAGGHRVVDERPARRRGVDDKAGAAGLALVAHLRAGQGECGGWEGAVEKGGTRWVQCGHGCRGATRGSRLAGSNSQRAPHAATRLPQLRTRSVARTANWYCPSVRLAYCWGEEQGTKSGLPTDESFRLTSLHSTAQHIAAGDGANRNMVVSKWQEKLGKAPC